MTSCCPAWYLLDSRGRPSTAACASSTSMRVSCMRLGAKTGQQHQPPHVLQRPCVELYKRVGLPDGGGVTRSAGEQGVGVLGFGGRSTSRDAPC